MTITNDIKYIGVNDHEVDLFEGQYDVPLGMAYNSYVILDEKIAVFDTVDIHFGEEWLSNLETALAGKKPDYLIVQHMEPDHSANIKTFVDKYPEAEIVGNAKTFQMMDQFFTFDGETKRKEVKNGETLSLGKHELTFVFAPMVHWPEVMVSFEQGEKVLFSADAFGKFGALSRCGFDSSEEEDWACEARRYYFNIVGKYGGPVQTLLKKLSTLEIAAICPLHGPVLKDDLSEYLRLYNIWSSYGVETEGVFVACASIHGNTLKAAEMFADMLRGKGIKVAFSDLTRDDMAEAVEDAFRYGVLVLAASSYDAGLFPPAADFISHLQDKGWQNRCVGLIENGSWAPSAGRVMKERFAVMKNVTILEPLVTIRSSVKPSDLPAMQALSESAAAQLKLA